MSASLVGSEMCIRDRSRSKPLRAVSGCFKQLQTALSSFISWKAPRRTHKAPPVHVASARWAGPGWGRSGG
eukprot:3658285-Alexandrium_andersonii.AAC.1